MPANISSLLERNRPAALMAAFSIALILLVMATSGIAQQPAGGRGKAAGGGGGFSQPDPIDFNDHEGWTSLFDGASMTGWSGDTNYWRVENGAIAVESTCEKPTG